MDFIALDVETANADLASICQIGLVRFEGGEPTETWSTLVDPQSDFDSINTWIHGITADDVRDAPTWREAAEQAFPRLERRTVITHGSFDRISIARASERHGVHLPPCEWLDTCMVARRTWPEVARAGYGLAALAKRLNIRFHHHDAAEDARAAGLILLHASHHAGLDLGQWLERVRKPICPENTPTSHATAGNPNGALNGHTIVFTGALQMRRADAARYAADAGCDVGDNVNKHTTLLVVGDYDITRLSDHEKSSKHRKAEALITKGQPIRILDESDFMALVGLS